MSEIEEEKEGSGASSLREDRATDASHGAAKSVSAYRSVSTGAGAFTPGPWEMSGVRYRRDAMDWRNINTAAERGELIGCVLDRENAANARLIAAAPLLVSALQMAVPIIEAEIEVMVSSHTNLSGPDIGKITGEEAEIVERMDAALNAARAALSAALGQGAR